jgi:hypothetical protein
LVVLCVFASFDDSVVPFDGMCFSSFTAGASISDLKFSNIGGVGGRNRMGSAANKSHGKRSGKAHGRKLTGPGVTKVMHPESRKARKLVRDANHNANKQHMKKIKRNENISLAQRIEWFRKSMAMFFQCDENEDDDSVPEAKQNGDGTLLDHEGERVDRLDSEQFHELIQLYMERFDDEIADMREEEERSLTLKA